MITSVPIPEIVSILVHQLENYFSCSDEERLLFTYTAYYVRLQAWAVANGETFSIDGDGAIESRSMTLFNNNNNIVIIVVAVSVLSLAVFALIALKRKHN